MNSKGIERWQSIDNDPLMILFSINLLRLVIDNLGL